jgi:hypothetical protein
MSFQEKRTLSNILTGIVMLLAYCLYAFNPSRLILNAENLKSWAIMMLVFIAIGVGASIVMQILFHILHSIGFAIKESIHNANVDDKEIERSIGAEMAEDERDKQVNLKSLVVGFIFCGVGIAAGLVSLALNASAVVMLNIVFLSCMVGSIFEGVAQIYYYRKGC